MRLNARATTIISSNVPLKPDRKVSLIFPRHKINQTVIFYRLVVSDSSSKVILLTNDKNLQTKALITNINVCSFAKLTDEIKKLKPVASAVKTEAAHNHVQESQVQPPQPSFELSEQVYQLNNQLMSTNIQPAVTPNQAQMPFTANELMECLLEKLVSQTKSYE